MSFGSFNVAEVLVAGLLYSGLGAVWYGLFAKPWMRFARVTEEQVKKGAGAKAYVIAVTSSLLCALALAWVIGISPAGTLQEYLTVATACAAGMVVAAAAKHYAFLAHPPGLVAVDGGYDLVGFLLMATVFWFWK